MDSGVSRIQQWREQKKKEKKEKIRAHYEKIEKIIKKVQEARKKSQEAKCKRGRSLRSKNAPIKEVTKKIRREKNKHKTITEVKEKLESKRKLARERSKRYRQKLKEKPGAEAIPIDVAGTPAFPNRMARKRPLDD